MKKTIIFIALFFLFLAGANAEELSTKLKGKILLQVESKGEAWYVNPDNESRHYLGKPDDAFKVMREIGLGISSKDFNSFNGKAPSRLSGKILIKVEDSGRAYYVNPSDLKLHFLGRPADAFQIMRKLGLGISNNDLNQILENGQSAVASTNSDVNKIDKKLLAKRLQEEMTKILATTKCKEIRLKELSGVIVIDPELENISKQHHLISQKEMSGYYYYPYGYNMINENLTNDSIYGKDRKLRSLNEIIGSIIKKWNTNFGVCMMSSHYSSYGIGVDINGKGNVIINYILANKLNKENLEMQKVVNSLISKNDSEREKIAKVYSWVTANISYDYDGLYSGNLTSYTWQQYPGSGAYKTFVNKKGVCGDYAHLLEELLKYVGIEGSYIHGAVSGSTAPHAWNKVVLDGEELYLDATWDAGYGSGNGSGSVFTRATGTRYFLMPEKCMILDHSQDYDRSLIDNLSAKEEFVRKNSKLLTKHCPDRMTYIAAENWVVEEAKKRSFELTGTWRVSDGSLKIFNFDGTCSGIYDASSCSISKDKDDNGRYVIGASGPNDMKVLYANDLGDKVEIFDGNNVLLWTMSR